MNERERMEAARRAYENGRWTRALPWAIPLVLLGGLVSYAGTPMHLVGGLVLAGAVVVARWHGRAWGRGVTLGALAGLLGALPPLLFACSSGACSVSCTLQCASISAVGGLFAGVWLWRRVPTDVAAIGLFTTGAVMALGCAPLGLGGLVGAAVALLVAAPGLAYRSQPA